MKKFVFFVLLMFVCGSLSAFAKPKRIVFKKGATRAIVSGYFTGYKSKAEYVIRVRGGQTLSIDSNRYITLAISDPNGEDATDYDASCNGRKSISPTARGDYRITVVECRKADPWRGKYNLNLTVK